LINRINENLGPNTYGMESGYDQSNQNEQSFPVIAEVSVSFAEYILGCRKNVIYRKTTICPDCKGDYCQ
jgi:DnaJ-class molecular chaperone